MRKHTSSTVLASVLEVVIGFAPSSQSMAQTGSWVTIIEGIIFVICVLTFREGIVGVIAPYLIGRPPPIEEIEESPAPKPLARRIKESATGG